MINHFWISSRKSSVWNDRSPSMDDRFTALIVGLHWQELTAGALRAPLKHQPLPKDMKDIIFEY